MRLPLSWMKDYVDPGLTPAKLADRLDLTGTEVDRIFTHGVTALDNFVVGRVLEREQHPDADRLSVCQVAIGEGDVSTIVCGAPNVAAGQTVGVALPGSVMPDGTRLKKAKLRGIPSNGMILAEDELAIGMDHNGIMVLDDDLTPGTPLADVLPISTDVLELAITSNRPDCLSIYGASREVSAATGAPLNPPPWLDDPGVAGALAGVTIDVEAPDLCPRFTARLFEDVTIAQSPPWLKQRLMASGQRPINNVVDITNYVMLLTGQPLHAFDWDLVAGSHLIVRRALDGEKVTTLDDVERTLDADVCIICDDDGPTGIAGVMGGQRSEVQPTTTRVLMEAANWNGPNIQRTSAKLGLRTEASARFDKSLAPEIAMWGQAVSTQLMLELTGARLVDGTVDVGGAGPEPKKLLLRDAKVTGLLGAEVPLGVQAELLERLDFAVTDTGDALEVTVPPVRRNDVTREVDLIEEVARLWGLDKLPSTLPAHGASGRLTVEQQQRRRAGDALVGAGFSEAIGWSFEAPELARKLRTTDVPAVKLRNPLSEDLSVMRTTLLGSLLTSVRNNVARGREDVRLFEEGSVYFDRPHGRELTAAEARSTPLPDERMHLAALLTGRLRAASWGETEPPTADFFAAKSALTTLLGALRVPWSVVRGSDPFLHPGRAARVIIAGEDAGWVGEVHPGVASEWDLGRVAGFELDLRYVLPHGVVAPHYEDLTSFPGIRQDFAFWVPTDRTAAELVDVVRGAGGKLLRDVRVFDVYAREGQTSLAVRLEFRASDRTLTDDEIAPQRKKIVEAVKTKLEGELRG
jgi:phenylalanyl-tRNA synthetase beta chain